MEGVREHPRANVALAVAGATRRLSRPAGSLARLRGGCFSRFSQTETATAGFQAYQNLVAIPGTVTHVRSFSPAVEDYVKAIYRLQSEAGEHPARSWARWIRASGAGWPAASSRRTAWLPRG